MKSKYLRLGIGVLISAVFVWLALRGLHLRDVWVSLRSADYIWLVPSVAVYFLAVWARTWRWDYLLRPMKRIPLGRLFPVVVIGYMGNNVYPFRAGELLRAFILRRQEGVSASSSLATIVVERVFDGLVMLLFVFVALPFAPLPSDDIRFVVVLGSAIFLGALLVFFAVAVVPERFMRLTEWLANRLLPGRLRAPLLDFAERFVFGLACLRDARGLLMIFLTSVVIWLLETVKYWFVMHAFDFTVSFFALMLMNGVVNLATTLPSAPGYIGTFDGPGIAVLTLYGVDPAIATAYTLTLHAALWLPITLLGFYYMVRSQLGWGDIGRAVEAGLATEAGPLPAGSPNGSAAAPAPEREVRR
ncbi:lysylphosphatidylglycerol synthase transmembrane domain-containing protein [Promineifilum sp.]|uniref:lysylphosphatidylglycerol synthase transmembrane domain-containing protein n=1 Tax=Promineifilum sp. TaxID=2664178 RepID=UPI0035B31FDE